MLCELSQSTNQTQISRRTPPAPIRAGPVRRRGVLDGLGDAVHPGRQQVLGQEPPHARRGRGRLDGCEGVPQGADGRGQSVGGT